VIEFSGKKSDWKSWSVKFLARGNRRGYKKLLVGEGKTVGVDKVPTQTEFEAAEHGSSVQDEAVKKLGKLNVLAYEDILLSIDTKTAAGKVAFNLVNTCYSEDFPEGNCRLAWDRLCSKFEPNTAPSLLKLRKIFANSKLDSADKDPDVWITNLEALRQRMDEIGLVGRMSDMEFMIHVLNNLPEEYDVVLDSLENRLVSTGEERLTLESLREKLNSRFERITSKEREKDCNEKALAAGFNVQFKGTCCKCGEYGHKSDSPKCPENQGTDGIKNPKSGSSRGGFNKSRRSNTICWNCGKIGHKRSDCTEREKANQVIDSPSKSSVSQELDLVLCTMDDVIIEELIEESNSSANEVAAGMQDKHPVK